MDPKDVNIMYAGTEDGFVYKSTNGGQSWESINGITTFNTVNIIAANPHDADTILVGTNSKYADGGGFSGQKTTEIPGRNRINTPERMSGALAWSRLDIATQ